MNALRPKLILAAFLLVISSFSFAQIEFGGKPHLSDIALLSAEIQEVSPPDLAELAAQDAMSSAQEKPYRIGIEVPVEINLAEQGTWHIVSPEGKVLRLALYCPGAEALGIIYRSLAIPEGGQLFVYSKDRKHIIGGFTSESFAGEGPCITRPVSGEMIVLEYYQPGSSSALPEIVISGLQYIYRNFEMITTPGTAEGGACQVNINCPEGDAYVDQRQSVVKILTTVSGSSFLCTGTIVNNTSQDFTPYILTANHCSQKFGTSDTATQSDLNKWIFYFNHQSSDCQGNLPPTIEQTMTGASFVASSNAYEDFSSDFLLLRLREDIPEKYNPFYCGWNRNDSPPVSGVCIHHPQGDVKKISTFSVPAVSASWETTPDTHWKVSWSETPNGHGVTEGGSSGAPLIDSQGLLYGTLTGGESACSNVTGKDYFGKFSYSWNPPESSSGTQLQCWLDPQNTGATQMSGIQNYKAITANLKADTTKIPVGGSVDFTDLSLGTPTSWHWFFEGGAPNESTEQNPQEIKYHFIGSYDVKLIVTNNNGSDTILVKDLIEVKALIYPNPTHGTINILSKKWLGSQLFVEIIDPLGRSVGKVTLDNTLTVNTLDLPESQPYYFLRLTWEDGEQTEKVIVLKN